jgi:hypothetical protein
MEIKIPNLPTFRHTPDTFDPDLANKFRLESVKPREELDHYTPYEDYVPGRDV